MPGVDAVAQMLEGLRRADNRLQEAFEDFIQRYFQHLNSLARGTLRGTAHLRMRRQRDAERRVKRVAWTTRIKATHQIEGRTRKLTRQLRGRLDHDWVYHIQRDWSHLKDYEAFERERTTLNSLRSRTVQAARTLRLSFGNRWAPRASATDRNAASRLLEQSSMLTKHDGRALAGAAVFARRLWRFERGLGLIVEGFRQRFSKRVEVEFEPALRSTPGGTLRVYWGFPERVPTAEGARTFTRYLPGRPTDSWMRAHRIRRATRREVWAFTRRLLSLELRYRRLVAYLGRHRKRVGEVLGAVSRHFAAPHDGTAPGGPVTNRAFS